MPELSRFHGVVVRVFNRDHPPPHVHVEYQGYRASLDVVRLELFDERGTCPPRARRRILRWARAHEWELRAAWRAASNGGVPRTIEPDQ